VRFLRWQWHRGAEGLERARIAPTDHLARHRIARQTAEDHHRRAAQAERKGVRIFLDHHTGQHVATSASNPAGCYHVSIEGCTCRGFVFRGRCKHHSLRIPDPEPVDFCVHFRGLSDADLVALKTDAARLHYLYGEALVNIHTGELIA